MKVIVLGAAGQLGSAVAPAFEAAGDVVQSVTRADLDVTHWLKVDEFLMGHRPDVVVNCTAFHNVVACERDPQTADRVNHLAVAHLMTACARIGAACVHVSTDYVFDGAKRTPYLEDDLPRPLQVYGRTKRSGELAVLMNPKNLVVRTSSLFGIGGTSSKGGDFPSRMLTAARNGRPVKIRTDLTMAPTHIPDLAAAMVRCVHEEMTGIVHLAGPVAVTWFDFALVLFNVARVPVTLQPVSTVEEPVRRPAYSVLRSQRVEPLPPLFGRVEEYVEQLLGVGAAGG